MTGLPHPYGSTTKAQASPASELANPRQPALELRGLCKDYGKEVHALHDINLEVREGEFVTLLGPSGSGKTTLLMVIAGFERPTSGSVMVRGVDITDIPPERRNFGIVFQSYALFPHMSVRSNVAYPVAARGVRGRQRGQLVDDALGLVGLEGLGHRRPSQLSGGQQQRVALARALVYKPAILLLDEPLGALDRSLRERMQVELSRLHRKVGVTFVYVTHDQDEALTMSDRVVVLRDGQIEQIGSPEHVYTKPASRFVATFVGTANLLPAQVVACGQGSARVRLDGGAIVEVGCGPSLAAGAEALVVLRPEKISVLSASSQSQGGEVDLHGRLELETFGGNVWRYQLVTQSGVLHAHVSQRSNVEVGASASFRWRPTDVWAIPVVAAPGAAFTSEP